jgi:hypothetical protein
MPLQEALVLSPDDFSRPAGVAFDPKCQTAKEDRKSWAAMFDPLLAEWAKGRYIMCLIQARSSRAWDADANNFKFVPAEDYLVAAYSVIPGLGKPYKPGIVAQTWFNKTIREQRGAVVPPGLSMLQMWQCLPQGCKLSAVGVMTMIMSFTKAGSPDGEAVIKARNQFAQGDKWGWKGGSFPQHLL